MQKIALTTTIWKLNEEAMKFLDVSNCYYGMRDKYRDDDDIIECIEKLGNICGHKDGKIYIVEIPDDVKEWCIMEKPCARGEIVVEKHRSWS